MIFTPCPLEMGDICEKFAKRHVQRALHPDIKYIQFLFECIGQCTSIYEPILENISFPKFQD